MSAAGQVAHTEVFVPKASSAIATLEYDLDTDTVDVTFVHGAVTQYLNIPRQVWRAWTLDASCGGFYNRNVKGKYPSEPA